MRAFRAPTLTALHDSLCANIVKSPADRLDVISSVDVQIHNTISQAESMEWSFDLKDLWLTPSRWSMMVKQYIDPEELEIWIDKCSGKIGKSGRGIGHMRTRTVAARGGPAKGNKETRRWGSCMLGISYKAIPRPTIVLYSRTSYLGYLSALDLSVAWMCGAYLAEAIPGLTVEDMSFVWMNEALQYHNFKSMAYLLNNKDPAEALRYRHLICDPDEDLSPFDRGIIEASPALKLTRKWFSNLRKLDDEGKTLGDMSYNTYRRIRRRYHTEVMGYEYAQQFEGWSYYKKGHAQEGEPKEFFKAYKPLPHTEVTELDFKAIGMPWGGEYGEEFIDDEGDDDEDDD